MKGFFELWDKYFILAALVSWLLVAPSLAAADQAGGSYDVVIYGGTSAGIAAAVQVKRMGH